MKLYNSAFNGEVAVFTPPKGSEVLPVNEHIAICTVPSGEVHTLFTSELAALKQTMREIRKVVNFLRKHNKRIAEKIEELEKEEKLCSNSTAR